MTTKDTGTIKVQIVDPAQMLEERRLQRFSDDKVNRYWSDRFLATGHECLAPLLRTMQKLIDKYGGKK